MRDLPITNVSTNMRADQRRGGGLRFTKNVLDIPKEQLPSSGSTSSEVQASDRLCSMVEFFREREQHDDDDEWEGRVGAIQGEAVVEQSPKGADLYGESYGGSGTSEKQCRRT